MKSIFLTLSVFFICSSALAWISREFTSAVSVTAFRTQSLHLYDEPT